MDDMETLRVISRVVHQLRLLSDDATLPDRGSVPGVYLSFLALHLWDIATQLDTVVKAHLPKTGPLNPATLKHPCS